MRKPRKKISQRAARRAITELRNLRNDALIEHIASDFPGRYAEPKGNTRAWIRGARQAGAIVTVTIEGPCGEANEAFVFTAWRRDP